MEILTDHSNEVTKPQPILNPRFSRSSDNPLPSNRSLVW